MPEKAALFSMEMRVMTKKIADKNVSFVEEEGNKYYALSTRKKLPFRTKFEFLILDFLESANSVRSRLGLGDASLSN